MDGRPGTRSAGRRTARQSLRPCVPRGDTRRGRPVRDRSDLMASNGEIELSGVPAHVWDRLSRHYDRQLWLERAAVRTALDLLAPARDERMLDLATGTGLVLRELAARRDR